MATIERSEKTANAEARRAAATRGNAQQRRVTRKKRPVKLAPRYARQVEDAVVADGEQEERKTENMALLRDVFSTSLCRCFIIKSFSDANFHKSLKYGIWSSTYAHNMVLDQVFRSDFSAVRPVLLFFSVCGTKHVNGIARMTSGVRSDVKFQLWEKTKYDGVFEVEWLIVKDVPNYVLTDIKMSNTPTKKSITSCRDCEEVLYEEANRFIQIFTDYPSKTSAWNDFEHFEALQPALEVKRGLTPDDPTHYSSYLASASNPGETK